MTRDEARAKCIKAMEAVARSDTGLPWTPLLTRAFDALATAGVRVVPAEATEEMISAEETLREHHPGRPPAATFAAMATIGDLTNPPEKKP
jgi:hypothetical protein